MNKSLVVGAVLGGVHFFIIALRDAHIAAALVPTQSATLVKLVKRVRAGGIDGAGDVGRGAHVGDDGEARPAVGAVDERVAEASVCRVEEFVRAGGARSDVGRDELQRDGKTDLFGDLRRFGWR